MSTSMPRLVCASLLLAAAACGGARQASDVVIYPGGSPATAAAVADSVRHSHTRADVDFMTGMIHHHAQALVMSRMAPTHGANPTIQTLAARIISGQHSEIALMQQWLADRGLPVPDAAAAATMEAAGHAGHAGQHDMAMAGMLSPAQLAALDAARGQEFDRLFLTYMIQHHKGAITMVDELFATPGGGQGDDIFKIASDVGADQSSEIKRMQDMLRDLLFGSGGAS